MIPKYLYQKQVLKDALIWQSIIQIKPYKRLSQNKSIRDKLFSHFSSRLFSSSFMPKHRMF